MSTGGDGIHTVDCVLAHVTENTLVQTYGDGVHISGGETVVIQGNHVFEAQGRGVNVEDVESAQVTGNQVDWTFGDAFRVARTAEATVDNNKILFAGRNGFSMVDNDTITLRGNIVKEAISDGIYIHDGSQAVDCTAYLESNTISNSQTGIRIELSGDFFGQVTGNVLSDNRQYGMYLQVGSMLPRPSIGLSLTPASIEANEFHYNALEGLAIEVTGAGASVVKVRNNEFKLNNASFGVQRREFVARLGTGAGPLTVGLDENQSYNELPSGQFNYDFLNASSSDLLYEITDPNFGTIGSSDGSVPTP